MFAIVAFDEHGETDFVPLKWIADNSTSTDVSVIIKQRRSIRFYWPPMKNPDTISKAKSRCIDAENHWPTYMGRILATAKSLQEARAKTKCAEDTSNLENSPTAEIDGKRKRRSKVYSDADSSDDVGDEDDEDVANAKNMKKRTKTTKTTLDATQSLPSTPSVSKPVAPTHVPTTSVTPTHVRTPSVTPTHVRTPSVTPTHVHTPSVTPRQVPTPSVTPTHVRTPSNTSSHVRTPSVTSTQVSTPSVALTHVPTTSLANLFEMRSDACPLSNDAVDDGSDTVAGIDSSYTNQSDVVLIDDGPGRSTISTSQLLETAPRCSATLDHEIKSRTNRLLLKMLSCLEDIKHTQKIHTTALGSILRQLQSGSNLPTAELPAEIHFPLTTAEEIDNLEEKLSDAKTRKALIDLLADQGGVNLGDFIRRTMKYQMSANLAREFNLTGQRGKRSYRALELFQVVCASAKLSTSANIKDADKRQIETELSNWFGNARDRGGGRRTKEVPSSELSCADI